MANIKGGISGAASGAAAGTALLPGIGTALGGLAGGIAGLFSGGDDSSEKQMEILQAIYDEASAMPTPEQKELVLERYRQEGILTPEMESVAALGPSAMEGVKVDPRLKSAQLAALSKIQQLGEEGLTPTEKAQVNQLSREVGQQESARRASILQGMAQRGMAGSGQELAAQLMGSQAAGERQAQEQDRLSAMASQRALEAMMKSGQLAGEQRSQDVGEQSAKAQAADVINRMNWQQASDVARRNIGARNVAAERNLTEKQRVADVNVGTRQAEQRYNQEAAQRDYENRLNKLKVASGAGGDLAKGYGAQATAADASTAAMLTAIPKAAQGIAGVMPKEKTAKEAYEEDWYKKQKGLI